MFAEWQIVFHIGFILGFFPVKFNLTSHEFTFKPTVAFASGLSWLVIFSLSLYLQLDFIFMIVGFGKTTAVGCNQSQMRDPDYIYSFLSALYFLYDFFILASSVFFARHIATTLSVSSILFQEFKSLNKEHPKTVPQFRVSIVNCLPVIAQMVWQSLFHFKKSCLQDISPSPQAILSSVLYIFLDIRSYVGILVFYDSLFLYMKNILVSTIKITTTCNNEETLFKNCNIIENLLLQLQEGFSYYLFVHLTSLVFFSTLNTYFLIICSVISLKYSSWYKLGEIAGILAMGAHTWMRIFYICSAGQQVST